LTIVTHFSNNNNTNSTMTDNNNSDSNGNGADAVPAEAVIAQPINPCLTTTLDNMQIGEIFKIGRNPVVRSFTGGRDGNDKYSMVYAGTSETTNTNAFTGVPTIDLRGSSLTVSLLNPFDLRWINKNVITIKGTYTLNGDLEDKKRFLRLHYARAAALAVAFAGKTKTGAINTHNRINWCNDDGQIIPAPTVANGKALKRDQDMRARYVVPVTKTLNNGKLKSGAYKCADYKEYSDYKLFTNVPANAGETDQLTFNHGVTITGSAPDERTGLGAPLAECSIEIEVGVRLVAPKTKNGFINNAEAVSTHMDFYLGHLIPTFTHHAGDNNYTGSGVASLMKFSLVTANLMYHKSSDPEKGPDLTVNHIFKDLDNVTNCRPANSTADDRGWGQEQNTLTVENAIINPRESSLGDAETVDGPAQMQDLLARFPYLMRKKDEAETASTFLLSDAEALEALEEAEGQPPAKKARTDDMVSDSSQDSPMSTSG
jgi:hypothetical protein